MLTVSYRKRIKLAPEKAIFIFVDDILPPTAALMSSIYEEHKWVKRRAMGALLTCSLFRDEDGQPAFLIRAVSTAHRLKRLADEQQASSTSSTHQRTPLATLRLPLRPLLWSRFSVSFGVHQE